MHPQRLPEGLRGRPVRLPDDLPAVVELVRAYDAHHLDRPTEPPESTVAQLEQLDHPDEDVLVVEDAAGSLIGLAIFEPADPPAHPGPAPEHWFDQYVLPGYPAAADLTSALTGAALAHTQVVLAREGVASARLETGAARADTISAEVFGAHGFTLERTFWEMARPLGPDVAEAGAAPPGVVIRQGRQEPGDRELIHRLVDTAFRDHWGHVSRDTATWWTRFEALVGIDPEQWWLAELDGVPVGVCLGDASRAGENGGYVRTLGVVREARGRGIAKHLLRVAFADHRRRGWAFSALRVDSTSPTGAPALYRSVGMTPTDILDLYARTVDAEPS